MKFIVVEIYFPLYVSCEASRQHGQWQLAAGLPFRRMAQTPGHLLCSGEAELARMISPDSSPPVAGSAMVCWVTAAAVAARGTFDLSPLRQGDHPGKSSLQASAVSVKVFYILAFYLGWFFFPFDEFCPLWDQKFQPHSYSDSE